MSDISELFARDPLEHTTQDIDAIIAKFREARAQFEAKPQREPRAKKEKPAPISLDDLNL